MLNMFYAIELKKTMMALRNNSSFITQDDVINIVCETLNITADNLTSPSRKRELVEARMICCQIFIRRFNLTEREISNILRRDRTTSYHYIQAYPNLLNDKSFKNKVEKVERAFYE